MTVHVAQIQRRGHGFQGARSFDRERTAKARAGKREAAIDAMMAEGLKPKTT